MEFWVTNSNGLYVASRLAVYDYLMNRHGIPGDACSMNLSTTALWVPCFRSTHRRGYWLDKPVSDDLLHKLYKLMK